MDLNPHLYVYLTTTFDVHCNIILTAVIVIQIPAVSSQAFSAAVLLIRAVLVASRHWTFGS